MTALKPPNPLQKFVRGILRDLVSQVNSEAPNKAKKPKSKKVAAVKSQHPPKEERKKRSRHIPLSVRFIVLQRNNHQCVSCGNSPPKVTLEVDHIVPFAKGGSNDISNLQTLCFNCNRGKGAGSLK